MEHPVSKTAAESPIFATVTKGPVTKTTVAVVPGEKMYTTQIIALLLDNLPYMAIYATL